MNLNDVLKTWMPAFAGMTTFSRFFCFIFGFLLVISPVRADQIFLKEGKVLNGIILENNPHDYFIRLGTNMYLRVDKSKVKKIRRSGGSSKKKGKKKKKKSVKIKKTDSPAPLVKNVESGKETRSIKKGKITVWETFHQKTYRVRGGNFSQAITNIYDRDRGKGFRSGRARDPSKTGIKFDWKGSMAPVGESVSWESVVIQATLTVTSPYWSAPKKTTKGEAKKWNKFIKRVQKHDRGHKDIAVKSLLQLGSSLSALRGKNEKNLRAKSGDLLKSLRQRTLKKQSGHDRRRRVKTEDLLAPE